MNRLYEKRIEWSEYEPESDDYVPVSKWGKDHWSTFAYLETRAVDADGMIDNRRMRCNARLHREFVTSSLPGRLVDGSGYPTRLLGGEEIAPHDDWSCLEDMVYAGLVKAQFRRKNMELSDNSEAHVVFTPIGEAVAAALRAFKASGGNFADFTPALNAILVQKMIDCQVRGADALLE